MTTLIDALRQIAEYARKHDFSIPCANIADSLEALLESHSNDEVRVVAMMAETLFRHVPGRLP